MQVFALARLLRLMAYGLQLDLTAKALFTRQVPAEH